VHNALWIVETLGNHTWNSLEQTGPTEPLPKDFANLSTMQQLQVLGFDEDTVDRMIKAEHEDWRRYYEDAGWKYDEHRDDSRRRHNRLLPWDDLVDRHPQFADDSRRSLLSTLVNLRSLGYRSVPKTPAHSVQGANSDNNQNSSWSHYRRRGEISAEKRDHSWTWTTRSGDVMEAQAGDWAVIDERGDERSVAAKVFDSTHEQIGPQRYRRSGTVLARRAAQREVVHTLEGDVVANDGDWIVQGGQGEQWPVPDEQFRRTYDGPLDREVPT
jgi:hypothetical protein